MEDAFKKILDPNNSDNVVLYDSNDNPVRFEQICIAPFNGKDYVILCPIDKVAGINEGEGLVMRFDTNSKGEDILSIETNEAVIDAIFDIYYGLLEKARKGKK